MAVAAKLPKVARSEIARFVKCISVERRVGVPSKHHWPLHPNLALFIRGSDSTIQGDNAHVRTINRGAIGVGELFIGVMGRAIGNHGDFGHAIAMNNATSTNFVTHFVVQFWWLRRSATGHEAKAREDWGARVLALFGQVGNVERTSATNHRGSTLTKQR